MVQLKNEGRWVFLNTLFSVSEAVMYAQLVDRLDLVGRRGGREGSKERKEEGGRGQLVLVGRSGGWSRGQLGGGGGG